MPLFERHVVRGALAVAVLIFCAGCATVPATTPVPIAVEPLPVKLAEHTGSFSPPPAPREFRGVWVATVANIDWPSKPGLNPETQRQEAIALLDQARAMNLNAVILQVRPAADALYASELEPWSEYLTGEQGKSPEPFYDPLNFWVAEAHRRGLELHAWFNPFRARHPSAKSPLAASHIATRLPNTVLTYDDMRWMDPGDAAAMAHSLTVVSDVTRRYDIDGVHIDDYFYPYPVKTKSNAAPVGADKTTSTRTTALQGGRANNALFAVADGETALNGGDAKKTEWLDFPDTRSWNAYRVTGGTLTRADWRRDNVDRFVEQLYENVKAIKPWVKVGISPFGLGRPDRRPDGIAGFSQYDQIYANVEHWLEQGWLDYLAPQLYWPIGQRPQEFSVLHDYWLKQNSRHRHVWPGLFTSKVGAAQKPWPVEEIPAQIALTRRVAGDPGQVHFSMVALAQNRLNLARQLASDLYATPALIPAMPWLELPIPAAPQLQPSVRKTHIEVRLPDGIAEVQIAIWRCHGEQWRFALQPATQTLIDVSPDPKFGEVTGLVVSLVNRAGVEGRRVSLDLSIATD